MNTLLFKYALEVEKCRSISQAAENLFMAQPNLSKAIHEIEDTFGFKVFRRTTKGVIPTTEGIEFLAVAREIVAKLEKIETIADAADGTKQIFRVSIPRASYISDGFLTYAEELDADKGIDVTVCETNSVNTISGVAGGIYSIGVIRFSPEHEKYFADYLAEKNLSHEPLWEHEYLLLMSEKHELAKSAAVTEKMLADGRYTEIAQDDNTVPYLAGSAARIGGENDRRINVIERANQFELLSQITSSYMWVSPVPKRITARYGLVQRRCADSGRRFRDVLVYPTGYKFSAQDKLFINKLSEAKNAVAFCDYD